MAKLKKLPKKPKRSASVQTLARYVQRVKEIKHHNEQVHRDKKHKDALLKQISGISAKDVMPAGGSVSGLHRRRKKVAAPAKSKRHKTAAVAGHKRRHHVAKKSTAHKRRHR